jgi:hypothetical protein
MSDLCSRVLLCSLWERTSAKGNSYLSGFLGKARVVGFRGESRPDGTQTWDLYLTPGKEQEEAAGSRGQQSSSAPPPGRVQRHPRPQSEKPAQDRPFFNDDISDLGRGR